MASKPRCVETGKRMYSSESKARDHVIAMRKFKHKRDVYPIREHFCSACMSWHITSQPAKKYDTNMINKDKFQKLIDDATTESQI